MSIHERINHLVDGETYGWDQLEFILGREVTNRVRRAAGVAVKPSRVTMAGEVPDRGPKDRKRRLGDQIRLTVPA